MAGSDDERAKGLAERSLNTSVAPAGRPGRSGDGGRSSTGNDQREGLDKTAPDRKARGNSSKP